MMITWLGHACFALESGGYRIVIDPYRDVEGLPDIQTEADAVYCSHGHYDHAHTEGVHLRQGHSSPFTVDTVDTWHDNQDGAQRGSNQVRRFTAEGQTVVHLGDLGHLLSQAQIAAIAPCDALLIPVGGTYTLDAAGAQAVVEQLHPKVIIPMHYRDGKRGIQVLDPVEKFLTAFSTEQICRLESNTFQLTPDTPPQVVVFTYQAP